jgi:RNA polymerase sigma factor (TIGR02999 family)
MNAPDFKALLETSRSGDKAALDQLFETLYAELGRIAHRQLRRGRPGETLSTTAVVHEAYLKLSEGRSAEIQDRAHFMALAARVMRQVIVDVARRRQTLKRGRTAPQALLDDEAVAADALADELVAIEQALSRLETLDPRLARIVEWRFFGGMSEDEIGEVLGITSRTVRREWREARAFLYRDLAASGGVLPE